MNNDELLRIALQQSAYDCNCAPEDFLKSEAVLTRSAPHPRARKYLSLPFYCAAWSNIKSVRNAIRCGFRPAWVELTARDAAFVDGLNHAKE